ncbi:hypothetical protein [Streptomyces sp. NPDC059564]|uniref:hypothetical protein n=1 Tax=Streptomyces sp. NPDC059564 TaxID=3346865 RepID=UPI003682AD4F
MSRHEQHPSWDAAVQRATALTSARTPGGMDERCWDDVAIRGILAVTLYSLHLRNRQPVGDIRWQQVLWQLRDDARVTDLATAALTSGGHDLAPTAEPGDPVAGCWAWLTRAWDTRAPKTPVIDKRAAVHVPSDLRQLPQVPELRWDGMTRGIGRGLPDPALVMNSSGVSRPSLSHEGTDPRPGVVRRARILGVSEVANKRYSFETWELTA